MTTTKILLLCTFLILISININMVYSSATDSGGSSDSSGSSGSSESSKSSESSDSSDVHHDTTKDPCLDASIYNEGSYRDSNGNEIKCPKSTDAPLTTTSSTTETTTSSSTKETTETLILSSESPIGELCVSGSSGFGCNPPVAVCTSNDDEEAALCREPGTDQGTICGELGTGCCPIGNGFECNPAIRGGLTLVCAFGREICVEKELEPGNIPDTIVCGEVGDACCGRNGFCFVRLICSEQQNQIQDTTAIQFICVESPKLCLCIIQYNYFCLLVIFCKQ